MFVKLVVLACVAVASAQHWGGAPQAAQYPAGVSPHDCPNYPHCGAPAAAPAWNGGHNNGGWNGGQNNGGWNGGNSAENGEYNGDGDYHGEGLQEAGAFGDVSQNWNDNNGQWNGGHDNNQWNGGNDNGQWNGGNDNGQWNGGNDNGQWNGGNDNGQWNGGHNAGQWNNGNNGAWNGGHAAAAPAHLPAGVDAHSCPNYPYCH